MPDEPAVPYRHVLQVNEPEWWHVFGGIRDDETWGECVALQILGPGKHPDTISAETKAEGYNGFAYITSVDHDPTQEEQDAWTAALDA